MNNYDTRTECFGSKGNNMSSRYSHRSTFFPPHVKETEHVCSRFKNSSNNSVKCTNSAFGECPFKGKAW